MEEKKTVDTLNYYDGISRGYNFLYGEEQKEKLNHFIEYIRDDSIILDAGAGTGIINEYIPNTSKLISIDLSQELLKYNLNENKIQADLQKIPIKKNKINCIICLTVIQDVILKEKVLENFYEILNNDGILIISYINKSKAAEEIEECIKKYFSITEKIYQEKDIINICKKN